MGKAMAEEEWITQTQESLGKLISKPKMTEKYLKKPPFRFLHDIVMEVVRSTNFAQGLYTPEECDAAQLSDKGAKVDFLNKAINATCFALGEQIQVSANKIVAGLEADKTNLWLQKLHQSATTCVGAKSDEAVQRVLAGESMGAKEKKKKKDDEPKAEEAKAAAGGDDAAAAEEEAKKKEEDKKRRAERKKKEEEKKKAAEEAEAAKAAEDEAAKAKASAEADAAAKAGEAEEEEAAKREKREEEKRKKEEEKKRREEKKRQQAEAEEKQKQEEAAAAAAQAAAAAAAAEEERRAAAAEAEHFQEMPSAPGSAAQGTRPIPGDDEAAREAMMRGEMGEDDSGRGQARPERPRTAGRRPPKLASKVQQSAETAGPAVTSQAPVIIAEGAKDDDDEDTFEQPANEAVGGFGMLKADEGGQHGKLVSNLLAEKKKEEEKERLKKEEEDTREEFEDGNGKGIRFGKLKRKKGDAPQQADVDIGALGTAIQSLCQAANPLGKSIDLVHQDIANMGKELDHWKQEYREASEHYQMQLKKTEELLQPLYQKVADLDDKVAEQKTKIRNSRSRISKNDLKIQGLLESVVCAK